MNIIASEKSVRFLAMTGYTVKELENLLPHFKIRLEEELITKTLAGKPRLKRKHSLYKNSPLPDTENNLLFILIYLKQGTT